MGSYVHTLSASLVALTLAATASAQTAARPQTPPQQPPTVQAAEPAPDAGASGPARERPPMDESVEPAEATQAMQAPPGHVSSVSGTVTLERANQIEDVAPGLPLLPGDRLRTDNATADITWADSSTLRLARFTELDILSQQMVRVPRGTLNVTLSLTPGQSASDQLAIDAPAASVRFFAAGRYRISVSGNDEVEVEVAVIEGHAQLVSDEGQIALSAGEKSLVRGGGAPSAPTELTAQVNDASSYDYGADVAAFQNGGQGYQSTQYLPSELYGYAGVLDQNGSWQSDPSYGYVWYPRVAADWRPYYQGQWRYYQPWGWTWIGGDRWSYPTHHYGRWGIGARGWYWIPARQWGPAWVSWAVASDYVSWCPLGWNGRPVASFYNYRAAYDGPSRYRPGRSWTVVPSRRFGYHDVTRWRINDDVVMRDRPSFITQGVGPAIPRGGAAIPRSNVAIPRGNVGGAAPLGRIEPLDQPTAVPRGGVYVRRPADADRDEYQRESPYDRARRVMERRGGDNPAADAGGDPNAPTGSVNVNGRSSTPTAVPRSGVIGPNDPRYGTPGRYPYGATRNPNRAPRNPGDAAADTETPQPSAIAPGVQRAPGRSSNVESGSSAGQRSSGGSYRARPQSATPPPAPPPASAPPPNAAVPRAEPRQDPPPSSAGRSGRSEGRSSEGRSSEGRSEGARRRQP